VIKIIISEVILFAFVLGQTIFAQDIKVNNYNVISIEKRNLESNNFHETIRPFSEKHTFIDTVVTKSKISNIILNKNLIQSTKSDYKFSINPELTSILFYDLKESEVLSQLSAGVNYKSNYKNKLYINTNFYLTQANFPTDFSAFIDSIGIIPGKGKILSGENGSYKYYNIEGSISYLPTENIKFEVGKGRNFLGAGYRSLLLSDNSNSYPYFKTEVNIWKIKYVWLVANLYDKALLGSISADYITDKTAFIHYLSFNIGKHINFNFFESVVSSPYDENLKRKGYDWSYYNPVIFYRPVEFANGTADNALMGAGLNLNFGKITLYSQFLLDDLIVSEFKNKTGWWGNKFGLQAGIKYFDVFNIENLFFLGEYNIVRPYTYSHGQINLNYGNYHSSLAHPLGSNFDELVSIIQYRKKRIAISAKISLARKGYDTETEVSFGGDIYKSYDYRTGQYDIAFLQGEVHHNIYVNTSISYIINPRYNLELKSGFIYKEERLIQSNIINNYFYLGISSNLFNNFGFFE